LVQLGYLERLGLLVDRRRRIGQELVTKICQLHQLVLELVAGGAKKDLPAAQAGKILYVRKRQATKELVALLKTIGTGLLDLRGIGHSGAARPTGSPAAGTVV
jgi:hypothetical protein